VIVMEAIRKYGSPLQFESDDLKADSLFALSAVGKHGPAVPC